MLTSADYLHLQRCLELAELALDQGHAPFGSLLVSQDGQVLLEDYNRTATGDNTQHPEFAIARWAAQNLNADQRKQAVVYTSGEHCPMCSAAHAWAGLGRIVYASSTAQLLQWHAELQVERAPVRPLSIPEVISQADVAGPVEAYAERIKNLHLRYQQRQRRVL